MLEFAYPPAQRTKLLELLTLHSLLPALNTPATPHDLTPARNSATKEAAWRIIPFDIERALGTHLAYAAGDATAAAIEQDSGDIVVQLAHLEGVSSGLKNNVEELLGRIQSAEREEICALIVRCREAEMRGLVRELEGRKAVFEGLMRELDDFGSLVGVEDGSVLSEAEGKGVEEVLREVYSLLHAVGGGRGDGGFGGGVLSRKEIKGEWGVLLGFGRGVNGVVVSHVYESPGEKGGV